VPITRNRQARAARVDIRCGYEAAPRTAGDSRPDKASADLIAWVQANEGRLRQTAPEDIEDVGIYANVFREAHGDTWFVVVMDNYAAMDTWTAMRGTPFGDLVGEFFSFMDPDKNADTSHAVLKSASMVTMWGMKIPATCSDGE
jgi:hypothetical protein